MTAIRELRSGERHRAADIIHRAFARDPMALFITPPGSRGADDPAVNLADVNYGLKYGRVMTTGDLDGVSIWLPPGLTEMTLFRMMLTGSLKSMWAMGWGASRRLLGYCRHMDEVHEQTLPGPHWYLFILAVEPDRQSQGLGGQLISPGIAWAEADGLPLYLETMNHRALKFYQRQGFRVVRQSSPPKGGPEFFSLIRRPGSGEGWERQTA